MHSSLFEFVIEAIMPLGSSSGQAQHTAHCASCTGAVRNSRKVISLCRVLLFLAAAAAPTLYSRLANEDETCESHDHVHRGY